MHTKNEKFYQYIRQLTKLSHSRLHSDQSYILQMILHKSHDNIVTAANSGLNMAHLCIYNQDSHIIRPTKDSIKLHDFIFPSATMLEQLRLESIKPVLHTLEEKIKPFKIHVCQLYEHPLALAFAENIDKNIFTIYVSWDT